MSATADGQRLHRQARILKLDAQSRPVKHHCLNRWVAEVPVQAGDSSVPDAAGLASYGKKE